VLLAQVWLYGYALASWVPPVTFCLTIFGLTVRQQVACRASKK